MTVDLNIQEGSGSNAGAFCHFWGKLPFRSRQPLRKRSNRTIMNPMINTHTFTLGQAASATGRSKSTISTALKSGKLSFRDRTDSGYVIDAAELFRVFPKETPQTVEIERSRTPVETPETVAELAKLRAENTLLRDERDDLRRRLDAEAEERRNLTRILTAPAPVLPPAPAPVPIAPEKAADGLFAAVGRWMAGKAKAP